MNTELFWLTLTTALTAVLWIPYVLDRMRVRGIVGAMANPKAEDKPLSAWAERARAAHQNAVENLAVFGVLILTAQVAGASSATTAFAAQLFFWARLAHFVVYSAGIPVVRTLTFVAGFAAQA
ncbi:MAG: MAPEG family protein, partial [Alphaproteobacteria bacterium]